MLQISYIILQKLQLFRVKVVLIAKLSELPSLKEVFCGAHLKIFLKVEVEITADCQIESCYKYLFKKIIFTYRPYK